MIVELFFSGIVVWLAGAMASLALWRRPPVARRVGCGAALAGSLLVLAGSAAAIFSGNSTVIRLPFGNPVFTWAIRMDPLSAFFNVTLAALAGAVSLYSFGYLRSMEGRRNLGAFGFFFNLLLLSLALVFCASNAFFFLVAWEVMALTAFCLVSFEHEKKETRNAGVLFLIMSHAGTGLLLIAFLVLASASGSLDFSSFHLLASQLPPLRQGTVFLLFLFGFGVKAGLVPVHIWLPKAHPVAPSNVSALMSGIVIKTGIYGMARVFFDFYGPPPLWMGTLLLGLGVASALLGVLYALMEHDLKRLLAWHSIENIGIILMGFGAALMFRSLGFVNLAALALIAALYHTFNHAIFKGLLFLGAGSVVQATHTRNMERMGGLIRRMPVTALCFLVGAVAISGLPPLNGFVSEWLTYQALLAGFGTTHSLTRLMFPIAGSLLALTAALGGGLFCEGFRNSVSRSTAQRGGRRCAGGLVPDARRHGVLAAGMRRAGSGRHLVCAGLRSHHAADPWCSRKFGSGDGPRLGAVAGDGPWRHHLHSRDCAVLSACRRGIRASAGAALEASQRPRTSVGLRPARVDRRQRIHGHGILKAAAHDLLRPLSPASRDPGGVRGIALLPQRDPLRERD